MSAEEATGTSGEKRQLSLQDAFDRTVELLDGDVGRIFQDCLATEEQLKLYGLYKHVTAGPVDNRDPPSMLWNIKAYKKHQAWDSRCNMSRHDAMREYVELVVSRASATHIPVLHTVGAQCKELLDQVVGFSEENASSELNGETNEQCGSLTPHASLNAPTDRSMKDPSRSYKSAVLTREKDARFFGLASLFKLFVTDILGVQPLVPRGQLDISKADLRFAAWQCFTAMSHVEQRRLYRKYESKIVQQWKKALAPASEKILKSTSVPKEVMTGPFEDEPSPAVIVGLSVRSLLDLYLRVKQYPAGSEVIVSPPFNVPGMLQVLEHHRLKIVGVDLPETANDDDVVVAVDCDAIEKAITPKTVAILVVHVFGMITATEDEMAVLRAATTRGGRSIAILEDCAECFAGLGDGAYMGSPCADLSFFSFGMIKTMTSLNGGIAIVRKNEGECSPAKDPDSGILESMIRLHNSDCYEPQQTNWEFLSKVCKSFVLHMVADSPLLYGFVFAFVSRVLGRDFDRFVISLLRGFRLDKDEAQQNWDVGGETSMLRNGLISQIRRRPSAAMLALMNRRLCQSTPVAESVSQRLESCRQLTIQLLQERGNEPVTIRIPNPREGSKHLFWLYPVLTDDPDLASQHLRRHGFDATRGASQLCCVAAPKDDSCVRATRLMNETLYLPIGCCSGRSSEENGVMDRMVRAINALPKPSRGTFRQSASSKTACVRGRSRRDKNLTLLFVALACGMLPVWLRRTFVAAVVSGLELASCLTVLAVIVLWLLRLSTGKFYLESSMGFAKYSVLLQNGYGNPGDQQIAESTGSGKTSEPSGVLSSLCVLDLPGVPCGDEPRSVFLTGGTGFIGSLLLRDLLFYREKLHIDRVVLLCRAKRGQSAIDRVASVLDDGMYSFLSETEKGSLVEVVEGDATKVHAGLSDSVVDHLRHKYSISHVFHCAASVSFTQNLRDAATANISSSLNIQSLASRLNKTRVQFVHISTAFVHGGLSGDENKPLLEELSSLGQFDAHEIYKSMCGTQFYASKAMVELGFFNSYTFSKSVCEHLLVRNDPNVLIIRPSIVGPAVETPYEGWAGHTPSTLVAAACLYLSYQWNLWSFGRQRVPCIPVDVVSRYILAKAFCTSSSDALDRDPASSETSSDEGFEKVSRCLSLSSEAKVPCTDSDSSRSHLIFTAAWDARSPDAACFTWLDYAGAVTQVGSAMSYFSRSTAYLGLLVASRLLPKVSLSAIQFEKLHIWCVQYPFQICLRICSVLGYNTKQMEQLNFFLDLPLLFYPFMNNGFHFHSALVAPSTLNGERYLLSCVAAAHFFVARLNKRNRRQYPLDHEPHEAAGMAFLPIGGSMHHNVPSGLWWALTQPKGNFLVRVAGWILAKVLRACYSEVTVDVMSFAATHRVKDATGSACVILAPTHRSFFDFLLLSYVSFCVPELQIRIPCIAAADEFERLPIVGWLLQFLGAFFVRRGRMLVDPCLVGKINSIKKESSSLDTVFEVFIEGTRSRDRRFVKPKTGVLRCLREGGGSYVIVPISISYERIAEQEELVKEASGGKIAGLNVGTMVLWLVVSVSIRNYYMKLCMLILAWPRVFTESFQGANSTWKSPCLGW
jgi:1-acyl-sn-glycerol-3-phosphate acyltransferase/nucleoside-diphosphate-sugar epimerase/acyl-CoA-binding protein